MEKINISVDLLWIDWFDLDQFKGKELILFNALKPWLGFNKVKLIGKDIILQVITIKTNEIAFNYITITKEKYLTEYFLTDNLFWHGF